MPRPSPKPTATPITSGWHARLLHGPSGPLPVVANAITALRHAPEWADVLHFNESSLHLVGKRPPPFHRALPVPFQWADQHDIQTAEWLQHQGILVGKEIAAQAVQTVAMDRRFHPVRDYLSLLTWDGVARIDNWLEVYLGVPPSDYAKAVAAKLVIGAVARVLRPGCKVDTCLILEGPQGKGKSTALRTLAGPEFFGDDIAELGTKDSVLQIRGLWIIELSELDAMSRADVARVKAFMSRQVDHIRPPYARRVSDFPRECIFTGTVNKSTYLNDETGARRFWPVRCGSINIADLERDRDQLWAEARERFRVGESWWLDNPSLVESAACETAERREPDPWDEPIGEWIKAPTAVVDPELKVELYEMISTPAFVTVCNILVHCIKKAQASWAPADQNRVARSLLARGWHRHQKRIGKKQVWGYSPPPVSPVESV